MVHVEVIISMVIVLIAMMAMVVVYAVGYRTVPPNRALVMRRQRRYPDGTIRRLVVIGGGRFLPPGAGNYDLLDLTVHPIRVQVSGLRTTREGNPAKASVDAVALVKVSTDEGAIQVSAEQLAGKPTEEVLRLAREALGKGIRQMFQEVPYEEVDPDPDHLMGNLSRYIRPPVEELGMEIRGAHLFHIQSQ